MRDGLIVRTEWEHHRRGRIGREVRDSWIGCPIEGCPFPRRHSADIFDRPGFRGAGTAVPVFSLRKDIADLIAESGRAQSPIEA